MDLLGQGAARHCDGRAALQLGLRGKEISKALGFGQIDPAIGKGTTCEFTWFGRTDRQSRLPFPCMRQSRKCGLHGPDNSPPTM
ncbi:hypothetical protein MBENS4_1596 [Novosphingobium sp. MBES04]|nr:hypothetical protein MBENS4_1596 [Novosphingobium sp. MBES04]